MLTCANACSIFSFVASAALRLRILAFTPSNTLSASTAGLHGRERSTARQKRTAAGLLLVVLDWLCPLFCFKMALAVRCITYTMLRKLHACSHLDGLPTHLVEGTEGWHGRPPAPDATEKATEGSCLSTPPAAATSTPPAQLPRALLASCCSTAPSHISTCGCCSWLAGSCLCR